MKSISIKTCLRCGHEWPTTGDPRVCPKCKSPYWDIPKREKKIRSGGRFDRKGAKT